MVFAILPHGRTVGASGDQACLPAGPGNCLFPEPRTLDSRHLSSYDTAFNGVVTGHTGCRPVAAPLAGLF